MLGGASMLVKKRRRWVYEQDLPQFPVEPVVSRVMRGRTVITHRIPEIHDASHALLAKLDSV
jgi:hypothetical protein